LNCTNCVVNITFWVSQRDKLSRDASMLDLCMCCSTISLPPASLRLLYVVITSYKKVNRFRMPLSATTLKFQQVPSLVLKLKHADSQMVRQYRPRLHLYCAHHPINTLTFFLLSMVKWLACLPLDPRFTGSNPAKSSGI
jgi:hypothetical protein